MPEHTNPPGLDSDAYFVGWQETISGDYVALYTITVPGHPSYQSTVSEASLRRLGLRVPRILSSYPETGPSPWHNRVIELNHPRTAGNAKVGYKVTAQADSAVATLHQGYLL